MLILECDQVLGGLIRQKSDQPDNRSHACFVAFGGGMLVLFLNSSGTVLPNRKFGSECTCSLPDILC